MTPHTHRFTRVFPGYPCLTLVLVTAGCLRGASVSCEELVDRAADQCCTQAGEAGGCTTGTAAVVATCEEIAATCGGASNTDCDGQFDLVFNSCDVTCGCISGSAEPASAPPQPDEEAGDLLTCDCRYQGELGIFYLREVSVCAPDGFSSVDEQRTAIDEMEQLLCAEDPEYRNCSCSSCSNARC